jgi:hypothetical protein
VRANARPIPRLDDSARVEFWSNVLKTDKCWLWQGNKRGKYGRFTVGGITYPAHRVAMELAGRSIPVHLLTDHTCRTKICVNPDHLRPATSRQNSLENSVSIAAVNAAKTHCKNGHEFTTENTFYFMRNGTRRRKCRTCERQWAWAGDRKRWGPPRTTEPRLRKVALGETK